MKKYLLVSVLFILFVNILVCSCSADKDTVLLELFEKFKDVNSISYTKKFVYTNTSDTAVSYEYYQKQKIQNKFIYDFNIEVKRFGKLHYQQVYNSLAGLSIHHTLNRSIITDHKNPPKYYLGLDEINFSLLTYIQYLKQTYEAYPENITIKDTVLNGKDLYLISFKNPDGIDWPDNLLKNHILKDTRFPLGLLVNKNTIDIEYGIWGRMIYSFSDICYNVEKSELIWDWNTLPGKITSTISELDFNSSDCLAASGTKLPEWDLANLENKTVKILDNTNNILVVLFSLNCGACIKEIPTLNYLNDINGLKVVGICNETNENEILKYIDKYNVGYEILKFQDESLIEKNRNCGFPKNYLVDENAIIVYSISGYSDNLKDIILGLTKVQTK